MGGIAAVNLLDHHDKGQFWLIPGRRDRIEEDAVDEIESSVPVRSPAAHEVLVREVRVELHRDRAPIILAPYQGVSKPSGEPALTRAGWALEHQVLL